MKVIGQAVLNKMKVIGQADLDMYESDWANGSGYK